MPIHVVIAANPPAVFQAITAKYQGKFYKLTDNSWVIAAPETAKEVSEKLGIAGGENGSAFVAPISSYFGRMPTDVWEWLQINWDKN